MRIALVTEFFYPTAGGTQTVVACIADELARRGHEVTVFAPLTDGHAYPTWQDRAYQVVWIPVPKYPVVGYLVVQYRMCRLLSRDWDVVHVFHPAFGLASLLARRLRRVRLIASLMGYDTYDFARMPWLKRCITLATCRRADALTAPSHDLARAARGTGVTRDIVVIPHGVDVLPADPERVATLRRALGLKPGAVVFVAIQRHYPVKEPMVFLDAWRLLGRLDWRLILVGGGEMEHLLRQRVAELELSNVTLTGAVTREEVPAYLALADVFVHHSRYEAFGLGILEAMRAGLPVIACDVGGVPEIITDGVNGLLIPPSDPVAMAAAVTRLAESPELRGRLSAAARDRAAEFSWDRLVSRYEGLYREQ